MTTTERRVLVHPDIDSLTGSVAARFMTKLIDLLDEFETANVVLTGGTVGGGTQRAIAASAAKDSVDWTRVHFWWGDERFVPKDDPDRNELQAREALLNAIGAPEANIHAFPSSDEAASIDDAAATYALELLSHAAEDQIVPRFDIMFLGVGPDGHVASLFPENNASRDASVSVVAVHNAPKPPPERLSLTMSAINTADRIWMVLAGADKASALGLALAGASSNEVPVAGVRGRKRTVFFIDQAAAADVPEQLIGSSY